jgi:hypothetical protein
MKGLESLKNQPVLGEGKFLEMVKAVVGETQVREYQSEILRYAIDYLQESVEYGDPTSLEMSTDQLTCSVGEEINLDLRLVNSREKPVKWGVFPALTGGVEVYYRKVGEGFIKYNPDWLRLYYSGALGCGIGVGLPVVASHDKQQGAARLFYNSAIKKFALDEQGEYEFRAVLHLKDLKLEPPTLRVRVVEPPEEEQAALAALRDPELVQFVEGDISLTTAMLAEVESAAEKAAAFLNKYPRSIYAPAVERKLRWNLKQADRPVENRLTPRLKAIKDALPDQ